ncbi:5-methylcytosine-specific restriction enzyme subunit McrB [Pantoea ananatis AJ13355]|uniref:5-methylcytosine-specific restriction enzyme subunit McrB n=1 Tax=Pantoea ananatis (strain AJ13355) TaxID=932677 RepID=A0A0H3L328_PANAA|nr:AAA family ATPase [Pantoea ananatis]BAK13746.1 5-methylcytosine-specific restriction enzyme subunit McrB [Pantoea ananatis AJ13355]
MSRYTGKEQAHQILEAASEWRQRCLINGGSLFSNKNLWDSQHLAEIERDVVNSQLELEGNFMHRLKEQLAGVSPEAKQLTAEMLWLLFLCASNISVRTKREQITTIWGLANEPLNSDNPLLKDTVLSGVGSAGTGFNTFRAREFAYLTNVIKALLAQPSAERDARLSDGFTFAEWLSVIPENANRQFRHMLMFMLFPDEFERIFSNNDRRIIIHAFKPQQKEELSAVGMDRALLEIRREHEEKQNSKQLDFYVPPLSEIWQKREEPAEKAAAIAPIDEVLTQPETIEPLNLILFGPPGTGKTYELNQLKAKYVSEAQTLTREQWLGELIAGKSWCDVVFMALWDLGESDVTAIREHEFIRAKAKIMGHTANLKSTIWASLQTHTTEESTTVNYSRRIPPYLFDKKEKGIWYVLPECEDECADLIELVKELKCSPAASETISRYEFVTFHQAYSYEDFVEGIRPELDEESGELSYSPQDGVFRRICQRAEADPEHHYAIFIDEINRGNVAKIFGELITLIETDKRTSGDKGMRITLPYSREPFGVPKNLDIYGTMNTADRSIALLDTALRRRFRFKELMPDSSKIAGSDGAGNIVDEDGNQINLRRLLDAMNHRIRFLLSRDLMLGHAYLCPVANLTQLKTVFLNQFIPLLQEYFYEDWHKIQLVFRDIDATGKLVEAPLIGHLKLTSKDVFGFTHDDFEEVVEYRVSTAQEITPDSIRKIYED